MTTNCINKFIVFLLLASMVRADTLTLENDLRVEGDTVLSGSIAVTPQGGIPMLGMGDLSLGQEIRRVGVIASSLTSSDASVNVTASAVNPLSFIEETQDSHSAWNENLFTAPFADDYTISATVSFDAGVTALGVVQLDLYVNGLLYLPGVLILSEVNASGNFTTRVPLNAQDTLDLRTNVAVTQISAKPNYINISSFKSGQAATTQDSIGIGGVPIGTVIIWMQETPPAGYLSCNGEAISQIDYPQLYNVIGSSYGTGESEGQFRLPDLRGYFLRGWDKGFSVESGLGHSAYANVDPEASNRDPRGDGRTGVDWVGTKQEDASEKHGHGASTALGGSHTHHFDNWQMVGMNPGTYQVGSGAGGEYETQPTTPVGGHSHGVTISETGTAPETRPDNIAVHYCIRYK